MKLDLKSVLIGALSVVCVVLLTGMAGQPPSEIGRYQRSMSSEGTASLLMIDVIDTVTGKVYRRMQSPPVRESAPEYSYFMIDVIGEYEKKNK